MNGFFGLTGSIHCGKSEVANLLSRYRDVVVFKTDDINKEILRRHDAQIKDMFGEQVFYNGYLDLRS